MVSGRITLWQIDGETVETMRGFIFWAPKSLQMVIEAIKLKELMNTINELKFSILKSRDITLPTKVHIVKSYGFSSSHVWI